MARVRQILRLAAWCGLAAAVALRADPPRLVKTIDRNWTFQYFPQPAAQLAPAAPGYDDRRWPAIALPHTWSTYETTGDVHPFIENASERDDSYWWYGWGWYRKHFTIARTLAGRRIYVEFDGVQKYARVYLNGAYLGDHRGGYTGFSFDLTDHVVFGADNVLSVEVSNRRDDPFGGIPPMTAGNFDVYGGIYRDVRLVVTDPLHIPYQGSAEHEGGTFVTTPSVSHASATVAVRTWVENDFPGDRQCRLVSVLLDPSGAELSRVAAAATIAPGSIHEFSQVFPEVVRPRLWSPDTPVLYTVRSEVWRDGRIVDAYASPFGIRWFRWDYARKRMVLNGHDILLRGMNRHEEYPWLGQAIPKWLQDRDLRDMRYNLGLNFQRTVHYPNDPHVYDLCDRLGFMLIEEQPNIKDIAFGRAIQHEDLVEAIRRDRNHPSILIWSMGNETDHPADSAWARQEDPTRIIYMRRAENGGRYIQLTDKSLPIENLLRCTVRGWYDRDDHVFGPEGPNPSSSQVTGTEEWQYRKCIDSRRMLHQNVVVWLYADHGCERNYLDSPLRDINPKGWTDAYRFPKFVYYLWEANFGPRPMVYIHPTYWRPRYLGQVRDILVDSNCPSVELFLDGRSLGVRHPSDANVHSVVFPGVRVTRGTLVATGRRGAVQVSYREPMAGPAARLVVTATPATIVADRSGISVVSLDIVDAAGDHVYGAHPPLTWSVAGPAKLVGPSVYVTDTNLNGAHSGTMYIDAPVSNLVRSGATPGAIIVRVSAPGFEPAEVRIAAVAPPKDDVPGIITPPLADVGRVPVRRDPDFQPAILPSKAHALGEIQHDYHFPAPSLDACRHELEAFVLQRNPQADEFSAGYREFIEELAREMYNRGGELVADDYNFDVRAFNERVAAAKEAKADRRRRRQPAPPPPVSSAQLDRWRSEIRANFFVPTPLPPLDARVHRRFSPAAGVTAEAVTYSTEFGLRVPAILYLPSPLPAGRLPGFVVVNGHGGDKYSWYSFYAGILYARAGMAVLTYDQIGEGERNVDRKSGTRAHDRIGGGAPMARRLCGLMITDAMQAAAYLASRPEVDPSRIGIGGYSLGSFVVALTGAVDTRVRAAVEVGGGNLDGPGGYWDRSGKPMCQSLPYRSLDFLGDRPAVIYALHAQRGPTLIWNGRQDTVVGMTRTQEPFFEDLRRRVAALRGTSAGLFDYGFTPARASASDPDRLIPASHRPYFLSKPVALWLDRKLHFARWTEQDIAAAPEVVVGAWARAHAVAIDRLYDTPEREAGLLALDADVPGYTRDELSVFTPEAWRRRKARFILETWVARAEASLPRPTVPAAK